MKAHEAFVAALAQFVRSGGHGSQKAVSEADCRTLLVWLASPANWTKGRVSGLFLSYSVNFFLSKVSSFCARDPGIHAGEG